MLLFECILYSLTKSESKHTYCLWEIDEIFILKWSIQYVLEQIITSNCFQYTYFCMLCFLKLFLAIYALSYIVLQSHQKTLILPLQYMYKTFANNSTFSFIWSSNFVYFYLVYVLKVFHFISYPGLEYLLYRTRVTWT